jgi:hypothetical protein
VKGKREPDEQETLVEHEELGLETLILQVSRLISLVNIYLCVIV